MLRVCKLIAVVALLAGSGAYGSQLRDLRLLPESGATRVVLDLDGAAEHDVFSLQRPDRLVIDLKSTQLQPGLDFKALAAGPVKDVRHGRFDGALRLVLDLTGAVEAKSFVLPPSGGFGYRLIIDLKPHANPAAAAIAAKTASVTPPPPPAAPMQRKPVVVAVDAGHGGDDPGAIGPDGIEEKNVTLAIARKLAALIDAQPGMKAVLTRDGDYYVGLRQRMVIARKAQADLFVSIHCNSYRDPSMHGTAVYVLSSRGASSEQARWLANRENSADLVGGVDLSDQDNQVAAVLLDISQSATMEASFDLAGRLLRAVHQVNALQKPFVQQAAFVVLKAPDIPSVLVETDFLTNRRQERRLASAGFQSTMAHALLRGIRSYFQHYRPLQPTPVQTAARAEAVNYRPGGGR